MTRWATVRINFRSTYWDNTNLGNLSRRNQNQIWHHNQILCAILLISGHFDTKMSLRLHRSWFEASGTSTDDLHQINTHDSQKLALLDVHPWVVRLMLSKLPVILTRKQQRHNRHNNKHVMSCMSVLDYWNHKSWMCYRIQDVWFAWMHQQL